ncbi:MAG: hypothetical protein ACXWWE_05750 [Nitrospira sp.]
MMMRTLRPFMILLALAAWIVSTSPALAVPKLTPGSKRYCSCTCATQDSVLFNPVWDKRYNCSLANNKKCTREKDGMTGRLHSCMECEKSNDGGMLCVNPGLSTKPPVRVPPGKLEQIVPRSIEGTQETAPPTTSSEDKGK